MRFSFSAAVVALLAACGPAIAQKRADHNFDLQDVTWRLSMDPGSKMIWGDVTNTLAPLADGTRQIVLDCGKLTIARVSVDGAPAPFKVDGGKLTVSLPGQPRKGQPLKVRIAYAGRPEAGVYFVDPRSAYPATTPVVYTQGEMEDTRYWLPTYDYPDDKATSEGFIEVPQSWSVVSNGRLVDVTPDRTNRVFHWKMDQPHSTYLISFVAGPYSAGHEEWSGIPVDWYVPVGLEEMGKTSFGGTADMVAFYSQLTGFKYPYAKFAQATVPDYMFGGMENITQVTNTIGTLHPPRTEPLASSKGLVLHELAHQWFGDTITTPDWANIWINEGFASFLPHFYIRKTEGEEAYDLGRQGTLAGAYGAIAGGSRPMVWTGYNLPIDAFDGNAYGGGAARMFMLMHQLGEARFWKGIGELLRKYAFKNVDTETFFASMSASTGENLDLFKKQWFYTPTAPNLSVKVEGTQLVVRQLQEPPFQLDVPVWVLTGNTWEKRSIALRGKESRLDLGASSNGPVLLDPEVFLMARIVYEGYSVDQWLALWRNAPNAAAKARIGEQMVGKLSAEQTLDLAKAERSPRLLENMFDFLQSNAAAFALEKSRDSNRSVAYAALRALRRWPKSDASVSRMREVWNNDSNDILRNLAMEALLTWTADKDLAEQAFKLDSHADSYRVTVLNWWSNTDKDRARTASLAALGVAPAGATQGFGRTYGSQPLQSTALAILGRLKDKPGERTAFEAIVREVQEPTFQVRSAAVRALADYGDPAGIKYLEPIADHSLHYMRGTVKQALATLRAKSRP